MSLVAKLAKVQAELKAPKSQRNTFGNYNYRSCEDILEAVKPLLLANGLSITISDEVLALGDRYYVQSTVTVFENDIGNMISTKALAREGETQKGMSESQITGSASSYARKYALNGMFAIDDTKDADATNKHGKEEETPEPKKPVEVYRPKVCDETLVKLMGLLTPAEQDKTLAYYKIDKLGDLTEEVAKQMIAKKSKK